MNWLEAEGIDLYNLDDEAGEIDYLLSYIGQDLTDVEEALDLESEMYGPDQVEIHDVNDWREVYARIPWSKYEDDIIELCKKSTSPVDLKRLYKQYLYRLIRNYGVM